MIVALQSASMRWWCLREQPTLNAMLAKQPAQPDKKRTFEGRPTGSAARPATHRGRSTAEQPAHHDSHVGSKLRKVDRGESSAARPGLTAKPYGPPADYKAWRWAECQKIAAPRRRNKKEMLSAYQKFKDSWKRSSEQRTKSHDEKRSHMHAHLEAVCGHRHAVWDYLQTGELPPLRPAVAPL